MKGKPEDYKDLFLSKIEKVQDCWFWLGSKNSANYGFFKSMLAHRFSYLLYKGEISENMNVCHACDNPQCVNPDHLWLGTDKENRQDYSTKLQNGTLVKKSRNFSEIRFRISKELYIKFKMICVEKNISVPRQMTELIKKFVEIMQYNDAKINQIKR